MLTGNRGHPAVRSREMALVVEESPYRDLIDVAQTDRLLGRAGQLSPDRSRSLPDFRHTNRGIGQARFCLTLVFGTGAKEKTPTD